MSNVRLLAPLLLLVAACSTTPADTRPADTPAADSTSGAVASIDRLMAPDFQGAITSRSGNEILVEAQPGTNEGAKVAVRIANDTIIENPDGERREPGFLVLGARVSVWVRGPVTQSYPNRATAARIVIDRVSN